MCSHPTSNMHFGLWGTTTQRAWRLPELAKTLLQSSHTSDNRGKRIGFEELPQELVKYLLITTFEVVIADVNDICETAGTRKPEMSDAR
jgi:hypothetical protein